MSPSTKNIIIMKNLSLLVLLSIVLVSCDFLDFEPKGVVSQEQIESPENLEGLVIAAYAGLGNDDWFVPHSYLWPYGSVRSEDAYKGGLGTSDIGEVHRMELHNLINTADANNNRLWERIYVSIGRANAALASLNNVSTSDFPLKLEREAEMRFIRGHFNFILKIVFKKFPVITEDIPVDEVDLVSNDQYTNDELWDVIADDFIFAIENLPIVRTDIGRPDEIAAKAYLAKVRLYQAYEQAEGGNTVTNINTQKLQEVVDLTGDVIADGRYGLFDDFAFNYLAEYDNGIESIFAVQRSKDDGSPDGNLARAVALNHPMPAEYGCCSFNRPTYSLVNAFKVDGGLPLFENYNVGIVRTESDFSANTFDPRLGHTIPIPGKPFKYQNNMIYNPVTWTRSIEVYGPFTDVKPVQQVSSSSMSRLPGEGFPASSKNQDIIRYVDVLLWRAEALIELGQHQDALPIINLVRERASNSTDLLVDSEGDFIADFQIEEYQDGVNINWTQENAREALRWERRLEFAMEGVRFFDLVRWGIAEDVLNNYMDIESERFSYLGVGTFIPNQSEYLPIPEQQIDFSRGLYVQNPGY
jgi:starch-binding outer membrane protein, SusD/RagB family